jgi:hypothetical protein
MKTAYDAQSAVSRRALATAIVEMVESCGFKPVYGGMEKVFARTIHTNEAIEVRVYTSVFGDQVDLVGADAIRVSVLYNTPDNKVRPLGRTKRVNRRGNIEDIVERTRQRMRQGYGIGLNPEQCRCGAPKFTSKAGNLVCADACWTK